MSDFESAAAELTTLREKEVSKISTLVRQQMQAQQRVEDLEADLDAAKKILRSIQEDLLPAAMAEFGLKELKMEDGSKVTIKQDVQASISKQHQSEALQWLRDHGWGDLIKNVVSVPFSRGEDGKADELIKNLESQGIIPDQKVWVEPMTLKAFVKQRINAGDNFPHEYFNAYVVNKAAITQPKRKW
jgi:hypothetical protein